MSQLRNQIKPEYSTHEAIRLGLIGVAIDHQYRDAPDLDLPYHAGNDSRACVSNCLTGDHGAGRKPSIGPDVVSRCIHACVRRLEWPFGSGARVLIPSIRKSELTL